MMSSTFSPDRVTLRQVIAEAVRRGCELVETKDTVVGPRGEVRFRYLRRTASEKTVVVDLPNLADDDELTGSMLRHLCDLLGIDPSFFGLGRD